MTTLYDLPEGSGRRFLFGLFGRDHDTAQCPRDGCGDCAIIEQYERDVASLKLQVGESAELVKFLYETMLLENCACADSALKRKADIERCLANNVRANERSLADERLRFSHWCPQSNRIVDVPLVVCPDCRG